MNVLSLFDGMSCGQIALERADIKVNNYYASEIDKYAIQVTQKNYPNTIQLGDIRNIKGSDLPQIDLVLGGSPCQGFSFSGKQLNFDDPRSALFFEFARLIREINPKYFLLENVKMKKEYQDIISEYLGIKPIMINSNLVSAQSRVRYYWTNIPNITQPEDKNILLRDILEEEIPFSFSSSGSGVVGKRTNSDIKAHCLTATGYSNRSFTGAISEAASPTGLVYVGSFEEGRRLDNGKNLSRNFREGYRVYSMKGKAATLTSSSKGGMGGYSGLYQTKNMIRKLTITECERLQTVPDGYTFIKREDGKQLISNTQRYKMLGNGWTVDVIAHILKEIKER